MCLSSLLLAQAQYELLRKEAETARLLKYINAGKPQFRHRAINKAGDLFIRVGYKLKDWYYRAGSQNYIPTFHIDLD